LLLDHLLIKLVSLLLVGWSHSSTGVSSLFPPCRVLLYMVQHLGSATCVAPHIGAHKTPPWHIMYYCHLTRGFSVECTRDVRCCCKKQRCMRV
jgi:hypothetical protein